MVKRKYRKKGEKKTKRGNSEIAQPTNSGK